MLRFTETKARVFYIDWVLMFNTEAGLIWAERFPFLEMLLFLKGMKFRLASYHTHFSHY